MMLKKIFALQVSFKFLIVTSLIMMSGEMSAQLQSNTPELMDVGVARIDITPDAPIRLAGYAARKKAPSEGVLHRLGAKAIAFGSNSEKPSLLITVDMLGVPGSVTTALAQRLSEKIKIDPQHIAIFSSHTHGGPELGNTLNILQYRGETFSDSLLTLDELVRIAEYREELVQKLEQVALAAMESRKPSLVRWGQGQAQFAKNRRTEGGPVDLSLPVLSVSEPNGQLKAVLVNYACHGTTLGGEINEIHGDWIAEAQTNIETNHPGAIALVAIGCGADANPEPRGKMEHVRSHAKDISDNVEKLLASQLQTLSSPPVGRIQWVRLPFADVPTIPELVDQTEDKSVKGYYARVALDRVLRGIAIPVDLYYPVQTWTFGDELAMINLAGEVVVDYAIRLKNELGAEKLWVNGYANDAPCYIASARVIREGGYEAESSMYWYDKPSPFVEGVEDIIIEAVHGLLPSSFKVERPTTNVPEIVRPEGESVKLHASKASAIGPEIKYMPEWKAFGWFTDADRVEWDVEIPRKTQYDVYVEWSVSDEESGKPFILEVGDQKMKGKVGQTGSWFTYKKEKMGRIQLPAGSHKVVFKPASVSQKGALMDLREITLVAVE